MAMKRSKAAEVESSESEQETVYNNNISQCEEYSQASDSDAPEAVSMSTSKTAVLNQIKAEREAKRSEKELKRKRAVALQEQNRQARLKKLEKMQTKAEEEDEDEEEPEDDSIEEQPENEFVDDLAPLPESVIQSAIPKRIRFASDSENEDVDVDQDGDASDPEEARKRRAAEARERLLKNLPFGVSEVGVDGRARVTREEIKARRAISRSKYQNAGTNVRRIDSVLDRSRKSRGPAKVFSRTF